MSPSSAKTALPLWLLIVIVGIIVGVSMGRAQSMGLYLPPVTQALGIGREPFGLAMALAQLLMGIGAPLSGGLIDKFGAGRIIVICVLAAIAGLYFMYAATTTTHLLISGVLMGIGVSGTGVTSLVGTIGRLAPPEQRLSAIASIGMAAGIGGFVALPVMHFLIELVGWQQSLLWLMAITALAHPAGLAAGRQAGRAKRAGAQTDLQGSAARGLSASKLLAADGGLFRLRLPWPSSWCICRRSRWTKGCPPGSVRSRCRSWASPTSSARSSPANRDSFMEKRRALSLIYFGRAIIFLGFIFLPMTPVTVIVLCGLLGLLWLATIPLTSGLVATFFGTTWMSMLFGFVFLSHQLGAFLGVWLGGRLYDMTNSYDAMWWLSIGLGVLAALLNWPIQEKPVARLSALDAQAAKA